MSQAVKVSKRLRKRLGIPDGKDLHRTVTLNEELKTVKGADGYRIDGQLSALVLDADKEVLLPLGSDLTRFTKNPVMLWGHRWDKLPIGMWEKVTPTAIAVDGNGLLASRPDDWRKDAPWFPDEVGALAAQKVLKGISVGFLPTDLGPPTDEEKAVVPVLKGADRVIRKWTLLEASLVSLPCCEDALITAISKGMISDELLPEFQVETGISIDALQAATAYIACETDELDFNDHMIERAVAILNRAGITRELIKAVKNIEEEEDTEDVEEERLIDEEKVKNFLGLVQKANILASSTVAEIFMQAEEKLARLLGQSQY